MKWEFNDDTPIYLQIMEHFKTEIASGGLKAGDKIPPVRCKRNQYDNSPYSMQ